MIENSSEEESDCEAHFGNGGHIGITLHVSGDVHRHMTRVFCITGLATLALMLPAGSQAQQRGAESPDARSVPGELLVQFRAGASQADMGRAVARANARVVDDILPAARRRDGRGDLVLVRHQPDLPAAAARAALQSDATVEFAEPNWIYTHEATATDPYFTNASLWGLNGSFGINAAKAWAAGTGSKSVMIGIIDEGIQFTHPDLAANIWTNPFDPVDGVDNDGNGYVDDTHGWDFNGNDNTIYDGGTKGGVDDHGTHVSGTIGAAGNTIGVVGVNWEVTLISGKFLGRQGGTTANAVKAVDYFVDLKARHALNIVATNNSWGGGGYSQALYDAIERANGVNILFIAAAGNGGRDGVGDNIDASPSYPASYTNSNIIAVAAITSSGGKASFSNYGATTVDIGAPGSGIWSTTAYNTYSSYSGTSMATPHVTGAVALYASTHPGATAAQIKNAILSSAVGTPSLAGRCVTGGRLDVNGALGK
jgi:subtilisin family serine protease